MLLFVLPLLFMFLAQLNIVMRLSLSLMIISVIVLYAVNVICTIINTIRVQKGNQPYRFKAIRFLR